MPFGSGTIGDWVCHVVDPVFWALDLGAPKTIWAEAKDYDPKKHADTFPAGSIITFKFPANEKRGPVKLVWHSGLEQLPRPKELEEGRKLPRTGAIVIGDKGKIMHGSHGAGGARLIPEPAGSNFDYGGPLTELARLGIIATQMLGQKLKWDSENMRFTNCGEANKYINPPYRQGWTL
jgi:hypothetical protein